ncbi:type 1 glutamine amidotransferase domain-containing protein [Roseibium alexandrii]|uniref:Putative intracellular protease/amidase n=1 Tax=Roseibium alexandrii (strain DSM 17067 / NCIMB 14079 / DFL-11) TaxID=244592 RepID=A0A5E8GYS4_ROSAD|nr:type 1 glutamine amidotransferase domain-containing protein [Roseibium alexandrii]EEE45281.1 putative intracellular protease/amidase [Roseibium alexandrii DFL-11]
MSDAADFPSKKRVLIIAGNPGTSPVTGWPVGFWFSELSHPYWTFVEAGYDVDIASPAGGDLVPDGMSDPEDESGYSAHDLISLGFKKSEKHAALLKGTKPTNEIDPVAYDAILVAGGGSPMVTMIGDDDLHAFVARAYEAGKIVALLCHGTCILLKTRLSNGDLLAKGKTWTGFADSEETYVEAAVGQPFQPFWIEKEANKLEDTNFIVSGMWKPFAVRDGNLITGQQQDSGFATAELVVQALGK